MDVTFYFDPSCPFCWITSRWLLMVSNKKELRINWRLFSLAIKNGELEKDESNFNHLPSHRIERVMLAASRKGANLGELYTQFGIKHFLAGEVYDDELISSVLKNNNLDAAIKLAADDEKLDEDLRMFTEEALSKVGADIGVPTIVLKTKNGEKGFFGPVIQSLPDQDSAIELWDGLLKLANNDNFFELKRGRTKNGPDVFSTAKC